MDENTLSMAEKMNQLYQEREEQYKKREKLFDDRSKQLQSLANALEKQKNSQEQKATDLDNREKELDQIQDALAAKVEDMEKQETALKNWEQETKESLAKAKQEQENELIKKRQELQMEKLQAQNLSIELQAERDNLKMMQENLKLYPDMSLPTDKETELQAKIETLQSRLSMAEKERDSKTEQMEKLQKDFDAKEAELANLQLKAEDSSTDPEVEEKLRKRNGELQGKVIELNKQVKSLQRDLDDQAKDKEELQRQLEENSNQPESHDLSAEELQNYLLTLPEFENVTTRHNTDGIIVDAVCGEKNYQKLSVGDKIPLSDADSFLIHQESGVLNYELHYLMNGTPQEYNAFLDLSKVKVADTLMDGVTHSVPPALSDYLERHQQLNDTELGAKRLQKLNCDSKNVSYANALLSYVREARECLNSGKQLPQRPTRSSITLEKPNEEVAVPLSEQTPEETAVPDLNSAPEISIPSSNNEEVMQHQNTTPESPEAEHQQAKMENLMDISLPLVDQEPFQEILQALLKNDMSQAANLLQYLGSHLDKLQEEHQKMQVEFRELKEQVNSIDERFFNDSDSVDTVQNNLDQSEKLITLNKSRLANVVLQTKSKLKTAGKNALLSFAEKIHVPKALASLQKGMQHTQDSLDVLFQRLNDAKQAVQDVSNSVKNVGRALTGKELLEYVPWDPEKGKIASVQRKIYAMERTLGNLQERTNTLLSKMQRPEQKPEKQVKKTTKKVI